MLGHDGGVTVLMQWLGFVAGLALLILTLASVIGTLVVPRGIDSAISRWADDVVDWGFHLISSRVRNKYRHEAVLAWQAPMTLLVRLSVWIVLLWGAYALVLLPFAGPAAFSEAGSSMFTLGYAPPTNAVTTLIEYMAAFTGVIVVGLQVGYLPTIYAAFNRRETEVTLLTSRAGVPAWGPELLLRTRWGYQDTDPISYLDDLFKTWERWAAEVGESHTTYVTLVRFRSPRPLSHWVTSLIAVMDAAAIHLAVDPSSPPKTSARLCIRMGFTALNQIAETMRVPYDKDPYPDQPISVSREDFGEAMDTLRSVSYPIEVTDDEAWVNFRGWRANYDLAALSIARAVDAPPALWTGPRRFKSTPMPPVRPPTRAPKAPSADEGSA
jgi:hypothetical protein